MAYIQKQKNKKTTTYFLFENYKFDGIWKKRKLEKYGYVKPKESPKELIRLFMLKKQAEEEDRIKNLPKTQENLKQLSLLVPTAGDIPKYQKLSFSQQLGKKIIQIVEENKCGMGYGVVENYPKVIPVRQITPAELEQGNQQYLKQNIGIEV